MRCTSCADCTPKEAGHPKNVNPRDLLAVMQTGFTRTTGYRASEVRSIHDAEFGAFLSRKEITAGITSHPADHSSVMPIADFGDLLRSQFPSQAGEVHPSLPFLKQREDVSCLGPM